MLSLDNSESMPDCARSQYCFFCCTKETITTSGLICPSDVEERYNLCFFFAVFAVVWCNVSLTLAVERPSDDGDSIEVQHKKIDKYVVIIDILTVETIMMLICRHRHVI